MSDDKKLDAVLESEKGLKKLYSDLDLLDAENADNSGALIAAVGGSAVGGAASFAALYGLGTAGLSAVGITSGLAAAGALVGGGMVAGVGVLAAPVAILAVAGYAFMNSKKQARIKALQLTLSSLISEISD